MCAVLACGCASGSKDAASGEAVIPSGDLSFDQVTVSDGLPDESSSSTSDAPEEAPVADDFALSAEVSHAAPTEGDSYSLAESEITSLNGNKNILESSDMPFIENNAAATEVPASAHATAESPVGGVLANQEDMDAPEDISETDVNWAEKFNLTMSIGECLLATHGDTEFMLVDFEGNFMSSKPFSKYMFQFYNGVGTMLDTEPGQGILYVDANGDPIIDEVFMSGTPFNQQGYALVSSDPGCKIIDKSGAMQT
jgi:hypothetical protein